ncbi:MAG: hypothetical protein PHH77_01035 [Victivallaceae bacterium]|nr:hypothetical protein [Victivallaceae bacterium]
MPGQPQIRIGTSGWMYRHWKERFYPSGLASARLLEFYSAQFTSVEIIPNCILIASKNSFDFEAELPAKIMSDRSIAPFFLLVNEPKSMLPCTVGFLRCRFAPKRTVATSVAHSSF